MVSALTRNRPIPCPVEVLYLQHLVEILQLQICVGGPLSQVIAGTPLFRVLVVDLLSQSVVRVLVFQLLVAHLFFFSCTSVSGSRNGTSMTGGSLPGSQTFSQDLPLRMMHVPQHPSNEHQPRCLSVMLNSDEEESQLPDEYYRACDDFPLDSTQPQPPTVGTVSICSHSFHLHSHCQTLRILTLTRYLLTKMPEWLKA